MLLFISSSEMKEQNSKQLMFKSIGVALAMIIAMSFSLKVGALQGGTGLNQWQENRVRLENYIYRKTPARCVIVGSSLGSRLKEEFLNASDVNLSLAGGDSLTGLEVILRSGHLPKCLAIETNLTLLRGLDLELIRKLFHPIGFLVKRALPLTRETYQPAVMLAAQLKKKSSGDVKPDQIAVNFTEVLTFQENLEQAPPEKILTDEVLNQLVSQITRLKAQGVEIYHFDLPRHINLESSPKSVAMKRAIKQSLDGLQISELSPQYPSNHPFQTEDGQHLTDSSARVFTQFFSAALENEFKAR